jgi:hypothetical protein
VLPRQSESWSLCIITQQIEPGLANRNKGPHYTTALCKSDLGTSSALMFHGGECSRILTAFVFSFFKRNPKKSDKVEKFERYLWWRFSTEAILPR